MITITEEIIINADAQKVWRLLSDFEISLNINLFHKKVIIPNKFSLTADNPQFNIVHNFGLGNIDMLVSVTNYIPLKCIKIIDIHFDPSKSIEMHSNLLSLVQELSKLRS